MEYLGLACNNGLFSYCQCLEQPKNTGNSEKRPILSFFPFISNLPISVVGVLRTFTCVFLRNQDTVILTEF